MSIHGHEILNHLVECEPTLQELREHVNKEYGEGAVFHTCSSEGMTLDELINFLETRGKFALIKGQMIADPEKICQHND